MEYHDDIDTYECALRHLIRRTDLKETRNEFISSKRKMYKSCLS